MRPPARPLCLALLIVPSAELMALAGGGDGYGAGGGAGGGGGSGKGGLHDGTDGTALISMNLETGEIESAPPQIWILMVAMIVAALGYTLWKRLRHATARSSGRRATSAAAARPADREMQQRDQALTELRQHDPRFCPDVFRRRVRTAFLAAQDAWSRQDLEAVRPFISDGIAVRWDLQLAEQRRLDLRDQVTQIRISMIEIERYSRSERFDVLEALILGEAVQQKLQRSTGEPLAGSSITPYPFAEYWSFLRRCGSTSLGDDRSGLIEGHCPNCAAPVAATQHARCAHCAIALRSGEHDWVLSGITQTSAWDPLPERDIAGLAAFCNHDRGFSPQALEDRASVLFYRWRAALSWGEIARLEGAASRACLDQVALEIQAQSDPGRLRRWVGEAAVGAARAVALRRGPERDQAWVELRWTGIEADQRAELVMRWNPTPVQRCLLLLERQATACSLPEAALTGAHCLSCGAPDGDFLEDRCRACGSLRMEDGAWILAGIQAWSQQAEVELREACSRTAAQRRKLRRQGQA